jgi:hypothetical protein
MGEISGRSGEPRRWSGMIGTVLGSACEGSMWSEKDSESRSK